MARLVFVALACVAVVSAERLFFGEQGKFKIAQFTDMHYLSADVDADSDIVQKAVLAAETPDVVVLTGDVICGTDLHDESVGRYEYTRATDILSSTGYKWAMTFGNHDDDGALTKAQIAELDMSRNGSLTQAGPTSVYGITNYYLPIFATEHEVTGEVPAALLWLLSVKGYNCEGVGGDGCVTKEQVKWFVETSKSLTSKYGKLPFSMMFFHIPTPEYIDLWNDEVVVGNKSENVCCPKVNTGLYDAAYQQGITAMFVGHDHVNDYCGAFHDKPSLTLCYGRKTGFGYYNPTPPMNHGSRIIELSLTGGKVSWDTWIREKDVKIIQVEHQPEGSDQTAC